MNTIATQPTNPPTASRRRLRRSAAAVAALAIAGVAVASAAPISDTPGAIVFSVQRVVESKVLPGALSTDPTDNIPDPNGGIVAADRLGPFGIASLAFRDGYFTSEFNADRDWKVDRAVLSSGHEAITVTGPAKKAQMSLTPTGAFYWFPTKEDFVLYELRGTALDQVATVPSSAITVGQPTRLPGITLNTTGTRTFVVLPAAQKLGSYTALGGGVDGARLGATALGWHVQLKYPVPGQPFATRTRGAYSPATQDAVYNINRQFFPVNDGARLGVVWQSYDPAQAGEVFITWLGQDPYSSTTVGPGRTPGFSLAAATSDGAGSIFVLLIETGNGKPNGTRKATLLKLRTDGTVAARADVDLSAAALDVVSFATAGDSSNNASLRVSNGQVGLMLARTMHQSNDGLNHQGGIAATFDANTLARTAYHGQTSGHSFGNVLTTTSTGAFLGIDLGDNFPRGVNLHRFDQNGIVSRVVFTLKTEHGSTPNSPSGATYPVYAEINTAARPAYQWSNDNRTYTELGGVTETNDGYLVVFSTERTALDNGRTGALLNDQRDLAAVLVRKDFENATRGPDRSPSWITDDLVKSTTGADAPKESGFYSFTGGFTRQRNAGTTWLTNYPTDKSQNAARPKTVKLANGDVAILWEKWSTTGYVETMGMVVRTTPNAVTIVRPETSLGTSFRLNPRDDLFAVGDIVYSFEGNDANRQIIVNALDFSKGGVTPPPPPPAPTAPATAAPASTTTAAPASTTTAAPITTAPAPTTTAPDAPATTAPPVNPDPAFGDMGEIPADIG